MREIEIQRIQEVLSIVYKTFKKIDMLPEEKNAFNDACDMFIELVQFMDHFKKEN